MEIETKRKEFDLDEGILIPGEISYHKVDDTHLFVAPEKASYICTNDIGKKILEYFKDGLSINTVMDRLSKKIYERKSCF